MAVYQNNVLKEVPIYGSNHLGNVLVTLTDGSANVLSYSDYFPFGTKISDRSWNREGYRYGFNGKENDTDLNGSQLIQDYGFRVYNPVIGKFLSVDPLTKSYPELTPYQFASNTPIQAIDLDGLEADLVVEEIGTMTYNEALKLVSNEAIEETTKRTILKRVAGAAGTTFAVVVFVFTPVNNTGLDHPERKWQRDRDKRELDRLEGKVYGGEDLDDWEVDNYFRLASEFGFHDVLGDHYKKLRKGYRLKLQLKTQKVGTGYDAHHTLPQKHKDYFEAVDGIDDIDDHTVWRKSSNHSKGGKQHEQEWDQFLLNNPDPRKVTKKQLLEKRNQIEKKVWDNQGDQPNY